MKINALVNTAIKEDKINEEMREKLWRENERLELLRLKQDVFNVMSSN